jgi:hypothetical protein
MNPKTATPTPAYNSECGAEKKVSGLFSMWFVMSQLPPLVTKIIPRLITTFAA